MQNGHDIIIQALTEKIERLQAENEKLKNENEQLKIWNEENKWAIQTYRSENIGLQSIISHERDYTNTVALQKALLGVQDELRAQIKKNSELEMYLESTPKWKNSEKDGMPVLKIGEILLYADVKNNIPHFHRIEAEIDTNWANSKEFNYFIIPQNATN